MFVTRVLAMLLLLPLAAIASHRDPVAIKPEKNGRYSVDAYTFGGVELTGFLGDLKDSEHIASAVLVSTGTVSEDDAKKFGESVTRAGLKALVKDSAGEREIGTSGAKQ